LEDPSDLPAVGCSASIPRDFCEGVIVWRCPAFAATPRRRHRAIKARAAAFRPADCLGLTREDCGVCAKNATIGQVVARQGVDKADGDFGVFGVFEVLWRCQPGACSIPRHLPYALSAEIDIYIVYSVYLRLSG
jgi:hypothetical protein